MMLTASRRMEGSASPFPAKDDRDCTTRSNSDDESESGSSSASSSSASNSSLSSSDSSAGSSGDSDSTRRSNRRLDRLAHASASYPVEVIPSGNANDELSHSLARHDVPNLLRRRPLPHTMLRLPPASADFARTTGGDHEGERRPKRRKARDSLSSQQSRSEAQRRRRRRRRQPQARSWFLTVGTRPRSRWADCCSGVSTLLVCSSFFVWLTCVVVEQSAVARVAYGRRPGGPGGFPPTSAAQHHLRARAASSYLPPAPPERPPLPPPTAGFVRDVWNGVQEMLQLSSSTSSATTAHPPPLTRKKSVEELDAGCARDDWQLANYPTCNELHSVDLGDVVREWKRRVHERGRPSFSANRTGTGLPFGYLSDAGLWRTVWAVPDPALSTSGEEAVPPLVMKLMKQEHEIDSRNLDRHRREAIVMERVTSSPYVASVYGYCGTTVLTEYLGATLHTLIKAKDDEAVRKRWGLDNSTYLSPSTPQGRLQMALHAARGLQALHENSIVHADLQDQQYLLSTSGPDGLPRLVLNDFNRCRFLAHRPVGNGTNATAAMATAAAATCTFRIPTAPGSSRSPEEYAYEELTEQIDVFSLANVLHQILTGDDPWEGWSALEISNQVQKGVKPMAMPELLGHPSDKLLQNLTLRAYELDPGTRIRATELVRELEKAQKVYF